MELSEKVNEYALPHASVAVATAKSGVFGQLIVVGAGNTPITGASVSITLIVWEAEDEFPHASVAIQVLVTLYSPAQSPGTVLSDEFSVNKLPHASVAVATANCGV